MAIANVLTATGLALGASLSRGFAIPIGSRVRGVLSRLYVMQTAGALDGYSYALYCTAAACPPVDNPTIPADAGLYNVVPTLIVPNAKADYQGVLAWPADGINHLWQPYSTGPDQRTGSVAHDQRLYLLIAANTGFAGKVFEASVTICDPTYT